MDSSHVVPDSVTDAKEDLYKILSNSNTRNDVILREIRPILQKHPCLANCEFEKEKGFYETPLLLACGKRDANEGKYIFLCVEFELTGNSLSAHNETHFGTLS